MSMWRPSQPQGQQDASAYDYNTRYNLQATEDSEDTRQGDGSGGGAFGGVEGGGEGTGGGNGTEKARYPGPGKRPNYRPTPLKWPFIACVAAIISVLIGLVVFARQRMPNSDTSAKITIERRIIHIIERRKVVDAQLWEREEIGDAELASIAAAGTPVITLPPRPAPELKPALSLAKPTPTNLPGYLRPGLDKPGQVVLDVPMVPCGGATVCTATITTDVISATIIQPPELSESIVTLGSTTSVGTTEVTDTVVVGGTPVYETGTTLRLVTEDALIPIVTDVEVYVLVDPPETPIDGSGDGDDVDSGSSSSSSTSSSPSSTTSKPTSSSLFRLPFTPGATGSTAPFAVPGGNDTYFGTASGSGTTVAYQSTVLDTSTELEPSSAPTEVGAFPGDDDSPGSGPPQHDENNGNGDADDEPGAGGGAGAGNGGSGETVTVPPISVSLPDGVIVIPAGTFTILPTSAPAKPPLPPSPINLPPPPPASNQPPKSPHFSKSKQHTTIFVPGKTTRTVTEETSKVSVTGGDTFTNVRSDTVSEVLPVTDKTTVAQGIQTYFSLGRTTIEVTYSPPVAARGPVPITHFTTLVDPGKTITGTIPGKPVAVVKTFDEVQTHVVNLAPQTVVTRLGSKVTNIVITVTPTPGPSPGVFRGISLTVVSQVGGTFETATVQDPPRTFVTNVNGVASTIVTTPPPRVVTNQVGGTLSTFQLVTTPTASSLLSFTVVTTLEGELTTIVTTPSPTTIVTTISGKLTTLTSTPSPSTFTSVIRSSSTKTIASIETPSTTDPAQGVKDQVYSLTEAQYFLGKFLPALLAVLLAIVLRIIDLNAKLYQPFYALNQAGGALGSNSMTLHYSGLRGFVVPFMTLFQGHPVPFITTMAVWGSSLMVPLATEGLGLKLHGDCANNKIEGCAVALGISPGPTHALLALMALIVMLLLILIYFLRNWATGLYANPWSVAGITSLARSKDLRIRSSRKATIRREMAEKRYSFGWFRNSNRNDEYGIILHDEAGGFLAQGNDSPNLDLLQSDDSDDEFVYEADGSGRRRRRDEDEGEHSRKRHVLPFIALSYPWRIAFIFFLGCLFILILYYHITRAATNHFTDFMRSQSFGVRFLFSGIGVAITFAWVSFFVSVAIITPYHLMSTSPQAPEQSILLTRPTHGIYGIYAGVKENNVFLLCTAFMALLSEFLPLLLANVPFNLTQTERTHVVCARITLVIIGIMMITLLASLFIKWPHMPVDPRSIAGAMYYISESKMKRDFEGVSTMDRKSRERRVRMMNGRYFYGEVNERGRVGVDVEGFVGEVEGTMVGTSMGTAPAMGYDTMSVAGTGSGAGPGMDPQGSGSGSGTGAGVGPSPVGGNVNTAYTGHQI